MSKHGEVSWFYLINKKKMWFFWHLISVRISMATTFVKLRKGHHLWAPSSLLPNSWSSVDIRNNYLKSKVTVWAEEHCIFCKHCPTDRNVSLQGKKTSLRATCDLFFFKPAWVFCLSLQIFPHGHLFTGYITLLWGFFESEPFKLMPCNLWELTLGFCQRIESGMLWAYTAFLCHSLSDKEMSGVRQASN